MSEQQQRPSMISRLPADTKRAKRSARRRLTNRCWHGLIALSGITVIASLLAIFLYLLSEMLPLLKPVTAHFINLSGNEPRALTAPKPHRLNPDASNTVIVADFEPDFTLFTARRDYAILAKYTGEACLVQVTTQRQECIQRLSLTDRTVELTALSWLAGQQSLISGDSSGQLKQWYLLPDQHGRLRLTWVKPFQQRNAAITHIAAEHGRSGFAVADAAGGLSLFYSSLTTPLWFSRILVEPLPSTLWQHLQFSASNQQLWWFQQQQPLALLEIDNRHPEISWRTLWQKVWYESWLQPEYVWQSSGGAEPYQGKYSLVPLTVGTLKAAFYALLLAVPLAVLAAIYCVCYLTEPIRGRLASAIEFMALFPTVIIGFLAAIWLAPALEHYLLAVLLFIVLTPAGVFVMASYGLTRFQYAHQPTGRTLPLCLMSILMLVSATVAIIAANYAELYWFGGSFRFWLGEQGVNYQQRNALVVGLAMGFAVIPVVFSISYDALAQLPRQLTLGAYALGANQWQIISRIMLPVAAPGILAGVMLGLSRAIGETMIILMATGNNPISNFNVFEGLRSLTATLVIELPEAAVDSSHYRVLFLVAILLFVFTFTCNTLADRVRQRLKQNLRRLD